MDQTTFLFLLLGGLVAIALAFVAAAWFHRQRSRFLRKAGQRLGLMPLAAGESFHFVPVALLRKKGRGIGAALRGTWQGHPIMLFDLFHPIGKNMAMQTVLMMELKEERLPEFAALAHDPKLYAPPMDIRPVDPMPPELEKRWNLYSRNGQWPFGPELTGWMAQQKAAGWSFEGTGHTLYVYRRSATAGTRGLRGWIDEAFAKGTEFAARAGSTSSSASLEP